MERARERAGVALGVAGFAGVFAEFLGLEEALGVVGLRALAALGLGDLAAVGLGDLEVL